MVSSIKNISMRYFLLVVKITVLVAIIYVIFKQFSAQSLNFESLKNTLSISSLHFTYLFYALLLVFLNYFLEIKKWQILTKNAQVRNVFEATKDIFSGLTLGLITPFMSGDFVGRSMNFSKNQRKNIIGLNAFNSVTQTYAAIFLGFLAFTILGFFKEVNLFKSLNLIALALFLASSFGLLFIFKTGFIKVDFSNNKFLNNHFSPYINSYKSISNLTRFQVLSLTLFRNLVYSLQFILIFRMFDISLNSVIIFIGVNIIYLVKTMGGGLNMIGDLGIRVLVGMYFFNFFGIKTELIIATTFIIWLINIGIPAILGLFFVLNFKTEKI